MIAGTCSQSQTTRNVIHGTTSTNQTLPSPNDLAFELTGRDYISYSAISSYQSCPLRYQFSYCTDMVREFVSSNLIFGSAIHVAIEHHFRSVFEGEASPSLDSLMAAYEQAWRRDTDTPVKFGKTESKETLRDLASRMLTAFQASEVSKMDSQLLAIEEEFRGPIIDGCPDVLGRLDLVDLHENAVRITDFKTSRSRRNEVKIVESAPQQLLYADLVAPLAKALGNLPVRIEWIVIAKAKKPIVERHALTPHAGQIARTKAGIRQVWRAISSGHFYPTPSSMGCAGCGFSAACRQWEG